MRRFLKRISLNKHENPQAHAGDEHAQHDEQLRRTTSHDVILDPDMHNIWKDMGWKGSVRAKHFGPALRGYFFEKMKIRKHQGGKGVEVGMSETQDRWALRYLSGHYLQSVQEAIDVEASGFITIEELNRFTSSRPLDWSLLKWLAYWAIGFSIAMSQQSTSIHRMLDEMFSLVPVLRRENQVAARKYLYYVWEKAVAVTYSPRFYCNSELLEKMFKDYNQSEEDRIRGNLINVKYKIDSVDKLRLAAGPGRIEKNFFAVVKVLLERHLQIFHIARTKVLGDKELVNAWYCFGYAQRAICDRLSDLKAVNSNHSSNLSAWPERFTHRTLGPILDSNEPSMDCFVAQFAYSNDVSLVWSFDRLINYESDQSVYDTSNTYDDSNYKEILVYREGRADFPDTRDYERLPTANQDLKKEVEDTDGVKKKVAEDAEVKFVEVKPEDKTEKKLGGSVEELTVDHPLIGEWRCLLYVNYPGSHPYECMFTINFEAAKDQPQDGTFVFTATGRLYTGKYWTLIGNCRQCEDGKNKFPMAYICKYFEDRDDRYFSGTFDVESNTISGTSGYYPEPERHMDMIFISKQPAEVLVHRPHPTALAENRIPSLWKFAKGAIILQVRKKMWSWSYFRDRRDNRRRYLELNIRRYFGKPLTGEEMGELCAVRRTIYPVDFRYLYSLELRMAMERIHIGSLGQERVICMDCIGSPSDFEPFHLCGDMDCLTSEISRYDLDKPHLPSHRTFKSRKMLLPRDIGFAWRTARSAITRGDKAITEALASYELENTQETILEARANVNDENDGLGSKVHKEDAKESGSLTEASHKKMQTDAELISSVTGAYKQGDAVNPQTVESIGTPSVSSSGVLKEPDSLGQAEDNTDEVDAQTATSRGEDVVPGPSKVSSGVMSHQRDEISTEENEKVVLTESENHPPDSSEAVVTTSDPDSAGHKAKSSTDRNPQAEDDTKSETSERSSPSRNASSQSSSSNTAVPPPINRCYYCDQILRSPCWYCVDCKDTILICMFCEPPGEFDKGHHKMVHTLLCVRGSSPWYQDWNRKWRENYQIWKQVRTLKWMTR